MPLITVEVKAEDLNHEFLQIRQAQIISVEETEAEQEQRIHEETQKLLDKIKAAACSGKLSAEWYKRVIKEFLEIGPSPTGEGKDKGGQSGNKK